MFWLKNKNNFHSHTLIWGPAVYNLIKYTERTTFSKFYSPFDNCADPDQLVSDEANDHDAHCFFYPDNKHISYLTSQNLLYLIFF